MTLIDTQSPEIEHANEEEDPKIKEEEFTSVLLNDAEEPHEGEAITEEELKDSRWNLNKKIFLGFFLLGFIIFVIVDSTTTGYLRTGINDFLKWIENNAISGMFAFMLVYFAATILFIPGSILTLGAGFVFAEAFGLGVGLVIATLSVFVGASLGAVVAFLLGRYLLRDWVNGFAKRYVIFQALDIALEEKGFRIMMLLRLSPIIPFNAINYVAGVSAISLANYCLALIGILPGTILFIFLGASAGSLADSASSGDNMTITIIVVIVGAVFGIFAVVLTSYYAKKELNRLIADREVQTREAPDAGDIEVPPVEREDYVDASHTTTTT